MTAARQRGKVGWPGAVLAAVGLAAPHVPFPVAATTEYVVADRHTGLAIGGYDPVAYFTDGIAIPGREPFEYAFAGATWSFRNAGNRAAFAADPDVYMPRFGGYDPVGIARGVGVAGNPQLWIIWRERLYLFYTAEARASFEADAEAIITAADKTWPSVQLTLSP